jgi:hypothetical protein
VRALVRTVDGIFAVDVETDEVEPGEELPAAAPAPRVSLPLLVGAAAAGSTVIAVVERRPPLLVSHDAGATWREGGFGLPAGRAVAISEDDPDLVLYGARNRIFVSTDGGRFWTALTPELPEIEAVAWARPPVG